MKSIQEAVRQVIAERVLPWIERDGISKLLLPEQITPADCARPVRCKRTCFQHSEHELGIGLTGKAPYCIDDKTFIFTPGRIVLMPGETPHATVQVKRLRTSNLDLDQPSSILWLSAFPFGAQMMVSHVTDKTEIAEISYMYLLLDRHVYRLMNCLLEEVRFRPPNYADVGRCILIEFLYRCQRATSIVPTTDSLAALTRRQPGGRRARTWTKTKSKQLPGRIQAARQFIHSNYHTNIILDDIASAVNIDPDYFGRQFKTAIGLTPIRYLTNVRMAAARQLLLTDMKISDVALLVGIEDPYYFSRLFRRHNGVSPLRYRQQIADKATFPPSSPEDFTE